MKNIENQSKISLIKAQNCVPHWCLWNIRDLWVILAAVELSINRGLSTHYSYWYLSNNYEHKTLSIPEADTVWKSRSQLQKVQFLRSLTERKKNTERVGPVWAKTRTSPKFWQMKITFNEIKWKQSVGKKSHSSEKLAKMGQILSLPITVMYL